MPRLGGVGMAASSYSPWAAAKQEAGNDSSSNGVSGSSGSSRQQQVAYSIQESLEELGRLAETAGLKVCDSGMLSMVLSMAPASQ